MLLNAIKFQDIMKKMLEEIKATIFTIYYSIVLTLLFVWIMPTHFNSTVVKLAVLSNNNIFYLFSPFFLCIHYVNTGMHQKEMVENLCFT